MSGFCVQYQADADHDRCCDDDAVAWSALTDPKSGAPFYRTEIELQPTEEVRHLSVVVATGHAGRGVHPDRRERHLSSICCKPAVLRVSRAFREAEAGRTERADLL